MEAVPHMRKLVLAGAVAALAILGTSTAAYGKGCSGNVKDPPSSVAQYTEPIPTACGSHTTGSGKGKRAVPKSIQQKIDSQGGADAKTLETIVSSESSGAPQTRIKTHKGKSHTKVNRHGSKNAVSDSATHKSNPLAASVGVITDGSDGRLITLIVLMVAVAAFVVVSALRRRRVTR